MNIIVGTLLILSVVIASMKIATWSLPCRIAVCIAWVLLTAVCAGAVASLPVMTVDDLADLPLFKAGLWTESILIIAYCLSEPSRGVVYRLLRPFPGVMCAFTFYLLLAYSFTLMADCNFAVCGLAVGAASGLLLFLLSATLRRLADNTLLTEILFATEITTLLLTCLI